MNARLPSFVIMGYCRSFEKFAEKYRRDEEVHSEALQYDKGRVDFLTSQTLLRREIQALYLV